MKTVRVEVVGYPQVAVTGEGVTIAAAVRHACDKLFGSGQSLGGERVSTHEHRWTWRFADVNYALAVHENRSGPRGEGTKRQVQLRLTEEEADRLDAFAKQSKLDRSAFVMSLVEAKKKLEEAAGD
jgi:hypothetical protein